MIDALLACWTYVIAGAAWIGSSFYFMARDASLKPDPRLDWRMSGAAWQAHGGGFHQIQKFTLAPEFMPAHLTWFKCFRRRCGTCLCPPVEAAQR